MCFFLALASSALLGCAGGGGGYDGPTGSVTGSLTIQGKPAPEGTLVSFYHKELGITATGVVDEAGKFQIVKGTDEEGKQIPTGLYEVSVTTGIASTEAEDPEAAMEAEMKRTEQGVDEEPSQSAIPEKYLQRSTSGETFDVKEGDNEYKLDLKP